MLLIPGKSLGYLTVQMSVKSFQSMLNHHQLLQQGIPNFINKLVNDLSAATDLVNKYVGPIVGGLSCPELGKFQFGLFDHFPGYKYSPTGPDTNY